MPGKFFGCLLLIFLFARVEAQVNRGFEYLKKRYGYVKIAVDTDSDGKGERVDPDNLVAVHPTGADNRIVITFSELILGLDLESKQLKSKRDRENFYLSIPSSPEYITRSAQGIKLMEVTNDGRLSERASEKVNKQVQVIYQFENNSLDTLHTSLSVRYVVDAYPDKTPIRPTDQGGGVVKLDLVILPSTTAIAEDQASVLYRHITDSNLPMQEMMEQAQLYLTKYKNVNSTWTKEVQLRLKQIEGRMESAQAEARLFREIETSFANGLLGECFDLCLEYEEKQREDLSDQGSIRRAEVWYYGILSAGKRQASKRDSWIKKLQVYFPDFYEDKRQELTRAAVSKPGSNGIGGVGDPLVDTMLLTSLQSDSLLEEVLEVLGSPVELPDAGQLFPDEDRQELRIETADLAETYIVRFVHSETNRLLANPSFKGPEQRYDLSELNLENGAYLVSLHNNSGHELARAEVTLATRKLSSELRYLLGVAVLVLGYFTYARYFKL